MPSEQLIEKRHKDLNLTRLACLIKTNEHEKSAPCGERFSKARKCDYARFFEDLRLVVRFAVFFFAAFRFFAAIVFVPLARNDYLLTSVVENIFEYLQRDLS